MSFPFRRFPFHEPPNTACIICRHVLEEGKPILSVCHYEDDGTWQFFCGLCEHTTEDARVAALEEAWRMDRSLGALRDLPCGCFAMRDRRGGAWHTGYQS